ncbi:hypothetical protein H9P43_004543 [Blastocladiella emersonii ATCC 22665]|nr:hypothetical protein H9P43_004543 [Blastocladiella emersonii ATCC 22665]
MPGSTFNVKNLTITVPSQSIAPLYPSSSTSTLAPSPRSSVPAAEPAPLTTSHVRTFAADGRIDDTRPLKRRRNNPFEQQQQPPTPLTPTSATGVEAFAAAAAVGGTSTITPPSGGLRHGQQQHHHQHQYSHFAAHQQAQLLQHQQLPLTPTTPQAMVAVAAAAPVSGHYHHAYQYATVQHQHQYAHAHPPSALRRPSLPPLVSVVGVPSVNENARVQVVTPAPASAIDMVADSRGLNPFEHPAAKSSVSMTSSPALALLFHREAANNHGRQYLAEHTDMAGGQMVSVARHAALEWLIWVNSQRSYRYTTDTMCVAATFMDRYLAAQSARTSSSSSSSSGAASPAAKSAGSPVAGSQRSSSAALEHLEMLRGKPGAVPVCLWRTYDWRLLALVCLSLAAKMVEEYDDPMMRDMASLDFKPDHVRKMQLEVAKALAFNMSCASPVNFIHEYLAQPEIVRLVTELLPAAAPASPSTAESTTETSAPRQPDGALEQWAGMLAPEVSRPLVAIAEQYLMVSLSSPESAVYKASERALAALNVALDVQSIKLNSVTVTAADGSRRVQYSNKSLILGFIGAAAYYTAQRANDCRDVFLRMLPREHFFAPPAAATSAAPAVAVSAGSVAAAAAAMACSHASVPQGMAM